MRIVSSALCFLSSALSPVYSGEMDRENHDNINPLHQGSGGTGFVGSAIAAHNTQTVSSTSLEAHSPG